MNISMAPADFQTKNHSQLVPRLKRSSSLEFAVASGRVRLLHGHTSSSGPLGLLVPQLDGPLDG